MKLIRLWFARLCIWLAKKTERLRKALGILTVLILPALLVCTLAPERGGESVHVKSQPVVAPAVKVTGRTVDA